MWFAPQMCGGFTRVWWSGGMPRMRFYGGGVMMLFMVAFLGLYLLARMALWPAIMIVIWAVQILCLPAMLMAAHGMPHTRRPVSDNLAVLIVRVALRRINRRIFPYWWRAMVHNQFNTGGPIL